MFNDRVKQISEAMSFATLVLLLMYSASSLRLDSIHQLFHAENITELHSAEKEHDPCHKNIYHQQKESGCEHKSHITQNTKCPVCEYSANSKEILPDPCCESIELQPVLLVSIFQEAILSGNSLRSSGRSPPQI